MANAPVPVTADMNIKVPVNLKLQPRRYTYTLIFTSIHLMYLMIHFLCRKLKKIIVSDKFFQIWHLFIFYGYCNYKQIRWRYTGSAFLELKVRYSKRYSNYAHIRWQYIDNIFQDPKYPHLNHKQISGGIRVTIPQELDVVIF